MMEWKNAHSFLFGHLRGRPPKPFKKTINLQFFCRKGSLTQWWPRSKVMHIISAEPHSPSALSQCGRRPLSNVSLRLVYLKQQRLLTPPPNLQISDGTEGAGCRHPRGPINHAHPAPRNKYPGTNHHQVRVAFSPGFSMLA